MKATIEFALPEEQGALELAIDAQRLAMQINDVYQALRGLLKHCDLEMTAALREKLEDIKALAYRDEDS